jgi:hypothetical protein
MESINLESFLSLTDRNVDDEIKSIILQNESEFNKLNESIIMINEILEEEKDNKQKILTELNKIKNIHSEAEILFSKIISTTVQLS